MSQNDLTTSININAGGNFGRQMRVNEDRWKRFSKTGQRQMGVLRRSVSSFGNGLDKLGNRYTALLTGAAGAGTAKFLVSLERRFTRLGIQANIGAEAIDELKKKIYETAQSPDIRVDPSQITSAIESIVEKTGDLDFAEANIRNIGLAIQATGAEGTSIGEVLGEFQKMGIVLEKDVLTALDTLNVQGKEGAFTLQNIAALGPRVVTAYTSMGRQGIPAIREMGAALQVIRQGTGSSEMAATAFEALMRTLSDAKKIDMLKSGGIKIFDAEALSRGEEVLRPINEIMVDIIKKTQGKKTLLSTVFDAEAMRAFNSSTAEFQRTGGLESLDKFMNVHADGTTTLEDSTRAANDAAGAMRNLYTAWQQFADSNLTTYIQSLADTINDIDKETLDMLIKGAAGLVAVGGTAILARKLYKGGKGISDFVKGSKAKSAMGGALGGMDGVTPVYVVNMRGGMDPTGMDPKKKPKVKKPNRRQMLRAAPNMKTIAAMGAGAMGTAGLAVGAAGLAGYGAGKVIYDNALEGTEFADALGRSIAKALALFGNDNAQAALSAEKRSQLQIEVTDKRVQVKNIQSDDMDINVDTGPTVGNL
ncbi:phage tail tape measure protein [Methylophaga thiooxydans]|uniref:Phage tail tape measure protein, TP901 family, core region n=2 Tax=Methylophaga thiooxydans DMS010 TaxID=637616 RepID=C0N2F6_9GAMM|nr:hypothetical protein [Methylophaga thiooxydans]EEF78477.1 hypothetical protein MDMS009_3021 [Methylophaga thiooxydans DMS010]EEF78896.1 hypothetical protein MDMS009_2640 [Methylophaga thiooxydans DMS010]EEF78990.1 hypothetical protein MDMS009_2507 [Methylophaga thiooxydans DMS010]EEF79041.1 hypothetical protein MDMS009_2301 [Methylophaga thiooxydans DMS010]EEF79756.1 hypothetical protein MDMS009_1694 [Methylophaga thiooxydans DMS010]